MKLYGSIDNRFDENKYYNNTYNNICVGDYATEYLWSDRHAYEVVEVKDQKHIKIRRLDAKNKAAYDNDWIYTSNPNNPTKDLELTKYGWKAVRYMDLDEWNRILIRVAEHIKKDAENYDDLVLSFAKFEANIHDDKKLEKILAGKRVKVSSEKINISFGIADEYFDWEF